MQKFETHTIFHCPLCGEHAAIDIEVPELNISSDKFSDHSSEGYVEVICPNEDCQSVFDGYAYCYYSGCEITLSYEDKEITLQGDSPMYSAPDDDEWLDLEVPEDAYGIFCQTYEQMMSFLDSKSVSYEDPQLKERMVFSQVFAALEAYLFNTLISNTLTDTAAIRRLLAKDEEVTKQKYTLNDIAADPDLLKNQISVYLRKIIYHNLAKVAFLYQAALEIDILPSKDEEERLHKAVKHRHDCVHRNGHDIEGNRNLAFSSDYVRAISNDIKSLVDRIDAKVSPF